MIGTISDAQDFDFPQTLQFFVCPPLKRITSESNTIKLFFHLVFID
jgi:hypothetical protein